MNPDPEGRVHLSTLSSIQMLPDASISDSASRVYLSDMLMPPIKADRS
jgi:hypothetical protein